ncbi:MAG: hypothetical protein MI923_30640 [Phycisphaerales bacterium]|nr:hypothetical protein [Phycisphaerales bacterium]
MKKIIPASLMLLTTAVMITTVVLAQSFRLEEEAHGTRTIQPHAKTTQGAPTLPALPARVDALIYAQPFVLKKGYQSYWSREKPFIEAGYLIVLKVAPDLVYPHEAATPVLYVGNETAERINVGYLDGHVIAVVSDKVDLNTALIWFGTPDLPERVGADKIAAELDLANTADLGSTITTEERTRVLTQAGGPLHLYDKVELFSESASLIEKYAPSEQDLADMFRSMAQP